MLKKLLPILVIIAAFALAELFLAAANLIVPWDAFVYVAQLRNSQFVHNREIGKTRQYLRDADLFWRLKPGLFRPGHFINREGFRGGEVRREKAKNVTRIICLGNSCTFGAGVDSLQDTYPMKLWAKIEQEFPKSHFEVINAGVNGYTTYQILKYWQKHLTRFNPDIITVYAAFNDIVYAARMPDQDLKIPAIFCTLSNELSRFRTFRSLDAVAKKLAAWRAGGELETPYDETQGIQRRVSAEDYRQNLAALAEDAQARGVRVVFITTPFRREYPICMNPAPRISRENGRAKVRWLPADPLEAEWMKGVDQAREYDAELQSALQRIERHPEMPASYFQAGYCYWQLGDSLNASTFFARADSLNEDRRALEHYNQIMREVAAQYNLPLVDAMADFNQLNTIGLFADDGIHPNVEGHALMADEIFRAINPFLHHSVSVK